MKMVREYCSNILSTRDVTVVRGVFGSEAGGLVQGGRRGFREGLREAG